MLPLDDLLPVVRGVMNPNVSGLTAAYREALTTLLSNRWETASVDRVFFIASKLIGALLRFDSWIVISLAGVVLALLLDCGGVALWLGIVTLALLVALSIFPLGDLLLQPIERHYPANPAVSDVEGIILLGGSEDPRASAYWGQAQLKGGGARFIAALALARRFPEARLLFTGGSGALRGAATSEAAIAKRFFHEHGIDSDRLLFEDRSRNTAENARLSLAVAAPRSGETWVLITRASHMSRAMSSFKAAGWPGLVAWPVDFRTARFEDRVGWDLTRNLDVLNTAIREQAGHLAYRLTGR